MSGWLDPLGMRCLLRYIRSEQSRVRDLADEQIRIRPKGRKAARYLARYDELGRMMTLLQSLQRPGAELLNYKDLVQSAAPQRRAKIIPLMRPNHRRDQ